MKPWPRDELKNREGKRDGELRRRLAAEIHFPDSFALIPTGCRLSSILEKDADSTRPVLQPERSGYNEHLIEESPRASSVGLNRLPSDFGSNPVAHVGVPAVATPTPWNPSNDIAFNYGMVQWQPSPIQGISVASPTPTRPIYGGQSSPSAFSCASSPPLSLNGQQQCSSQFGQVNGFQFNQLPLPPLQPTYPDGTQLGSMADFARNRDSAAPSPRGAALLPSNGHTNLQPIHTLLRPAERLPLPQETQDMDAFASQTKFISGLPVRATPTTDSLGFVPNISTPAAAGLQPRTSSQHYQPNVGSPALLLNMGNQLNSPNPYSFQALTQMLPTPIMCHAPALAPSPALYSNTA